MSAKRELLERKEAILTAIERRDADAAVKVDCELAADGWDMSDVDDFVEQSGGDMVIWGELVERDQ
jgi:hypothetical protein